MSAAEGKQEDAGAKKTPSDFLKTVLGRPVVVKLNSGVDYRGVLACLDGYMNIAMEQTEEYVDGQLKNKYGDCFIRGNNGTCPYSEDDEMVGVGGAGEMGGVAAVEVAVARFAPPPLCTAPRCSLHHSATCSCHPSAATECA